ncbi:PREDICTED: tetratricopeptide repeat protein 31 [Lepidothrix coronata]|uniref:Tetratricopeptide repeat protein 31 n=1 Tax=Lepidothrix coronata TaxID=321398 RepID=A0A6J0J6H7_9PASS|nr:PREDICTED: tetratricopeptide repeat protein 31 [Lepidothrix coronata]
MGPSALEELPAGRPITRGRPGRQQQQDEAAQAGVAHLRGAGGSGPPGWGEGRGHRRWGGAIPLVPPLRAGSGGALRADHAPFRNSHAPCLTGHAPSPLATPPPWPLPWRRRAARARCPPARPAPFCPWHRLSGLGDLPVLPQGPSQTVIQYEGGEVCLLWDDGPRLEDFYQLGDDDEDESDTDYEERDEFLDVPLAERPRPYSYCGFRKSFLCAEPPVPQPPRTPPSALEVRLDRLPTPRWARLTAEEAERNAQELVAEEERVKRKAEKKKLKKKKQKDRKKREKLGQEQKNKENTDPSPPVPSGLTGTGSPQDGAEEEGECTDPSPHPENSTAPPEDTEGAEEELDLSCTFVCKAREKAGVRLPTPGRERPPGTGDTEPGRRAPEKGSGEGPAPPRVPQPPGPSAVEQSLMLAGRGIAAAQAGRHDEAVRAFSAALKLNPREHRLLGNRSYCLEKLGRYEEALGDAEAALGLQPGWPKGSFRKGKALRGLQRYAEAARTFEELLLRDGAHAEAAAQLEACRALLRQHSRPGGVPVSPFLPETKEPPLLPGGWASGSCQQTGDTSGGGGSTGTPTRDQGRGPATAASRLTLPPSHPARDCFPLWVGNVTPQISEKVLRRTFGRFGEIHSVRMLPGRRCAFINFCGKAAAEAAFGAMQGATVEGSELVLQLKHPSHATPAPLPRARGGPAPGGLLR